MNFNGTAARIDIAQYYNGTTFDVPASTGAMTITAWFKATTLSNNQRIFCKATEIVNVPDTAGSCSYFIRVGNVSGTQRIGVGLRTGTTSTFLDDSTTAIATGTVYFVCLWYDGSNMKIYTNAVETASTAKTGNVDVNSAKAVYIADNPNIRVRFDGVIEDVRIYTRALSVPEIQTIYYSRGFDRIVYGLYARWPLNEHHVGAYSSLEKEVKDHGPNKFDVTSEDAGYALSFNGSSDLINLASVNSDFQLVAPFTIEGWVKPSTIAAGVARIFGTHNGSNGVSFGRNAGKLRLTLHGVHDFDTTNSYLTAGVWTHIAVQFYNGTFNKSAEFFVNGSSVQTVTWGFGSDPGTTLSGAQIGADGVGTSYELWAGSINMVRVWKGLAVDNASQALYIYEHPKSSSNLKGYWKLREGSGTTTADVSGNSHTGTLTGCTWEVSDAWAHPTYIEPISHLRT